MNFKTPPAIANVGLAVVQDAKTIGSVVGPKLVASKNAFQNFVHQRLVKAAERTAPQMQVSVEKQN